MRLADLLCSLLHLPAKAAQGAGAAAGGHSLQMRWAPACTAIDAGPMPLLSPALACRPPPLALGGPCPAGPAWQPSLSAMPDASRFRQPMTGPRLAAAQRQAAARGTSTSLRAVRIAAEHAPVVAAVRRALAERGVALPPSHFADADVELARYAVTVGLLAAETPQDRRARPPASPLACAPARCHCNADAGPALGACTRAVRLRCSACVHALREAQVQCMHHMQPAVLR